MTVIWNVSLYLRLEYDFSMENNTLSPQDQTSHNLSMKPKSKSSAKTLLVILLVLLVLAAGAAAGYFYSQKDKDQAVKDAQAVATAESNKTGNNQSTTETRPTHETTPPKTKEGKTCNADELSLTTAVADGGGAAGTIYYSIVLTNKGSRSCDLGGYPGVSLVNDNGNQIGSPADRVTGQPEALVTLAPGAKAQAVIGVPQSNNFPAGQCKEGATKLRVYPPSDTGYLSGLSEIKSWCPGFNVAPVKAV